MNLKNKNENNNKLSKQPEQEQNHRYRDHLEGYQLGGGKERKGKWCRGKGKSKSIIGRNKIDRGRLRIA